MPLPTDRSFDKVVILNPQDAIAHARCVMKLRRVDTELQQIGEVYLPSRYDPLSYTPHDSHQVAMVEHALNCIHDAEQFAMQVMDEKLQKELLEDIHMRRLILYDTLDIIQLAEKRAKLKEKEGSTKD